MKKVLCILTLLLGAASTAAHAAFDPLDLSARARAMGGATVAVPADAWAFYNNPAALAYLGKARIGASTSQINGNDFNRLNALGGSVQLKKGVQGLSFGIRDYGVEYQDTDLLNEVTLTVSHGFQLFKDSSTSAALGWGLNFYNVKFGRTIGLSGDGSDGIDPGDEWSVGLDLGAQVSVYERTRVGFMIKNVNNPTFGLNEEQILQQVAIGISYEPYSGVITDFDLRSRNGEAFRVHGGAEVLIVPQLALRVGVETDPNKLAAGFAINVPWVSLDYAFSTGGGVLGTTHQFALTYRFGGRQP